MATGRGPDGTPPVARIGDREDWPLPARVDADLPQIVPEPIGLVSPEKRSTEVPFTSAEEPSDPTGDTASREVGPIRTVLEVPELKRDFGLSIPTGIRILHHAIPTVPRAGRFEQPVRHAAERTIVRVTPRKHCSPTKGGDRWIG
jgi:hypothetical protein